MILINYIVAICLIALGLYVMCAKRELIKIVIGMGITDYGINLLIVSIGFHENGTAPIYTLSDIINGNLSHFVDPIPQALTLTSIVIGACVDAMALALVIMIRRKYNTTDADEVRRLKG